MAGESAIFRTAAPGDTEADARTAGEIIEFNSGSAPDNTGRHIATGFRMIRDVSPHPAPKRANTKWQDNLLGTTEVTVTGYFRSHDSSTGPAQLFDWQAEASTTSTLPFGNFGLRLDNFANGKLNLVPTATAGYLLVDVEVQDVETPRDQVTFIARFIRNGTI